MEERIKLVRLLESLHSEGGRLPLSRLSSKLRDFREGKWEGSKLIGISPDSVLWERSNWVSEGSREPKRPDRLPEKEFLWRFNSDKRGVMLNEGMGPEKKLLSRKSFERLAKRPVVTREERKDALEKELTERSRELRRPELGREEVSKGPER